VSDEEATSNPIIWLGKIGVALVEKVPGGPLAAICLALIIAILGVVAILASGAGAVVVAIWLVFVIVFVAVGAWAFSRYRVENQAVAQLGKVTVKSDVFDLANRLDARERKDLLEVLRRVRVEASQFLDVGLENVRANVFGLTSSGELRIVNGLDDNMTKPEERTIVLRPGVGSTGIAYQTREPNIAVLKEDWGRAAISDSELAKLDGRLRWILSIPVLNVADAPPICVLNIDGFDDLTAEQLAPLIDQMATWATFVGLQFAAVLTRVEKEVPK
jgi:hypothetical protein